VDDTNTLIALIIVDLDYFKLVNDKYGHWTGDQVLRAVADTMEQSLGKLGRVGRLGGEEFAFLARTRDQAVVLEALDAFRRAVSKLSIKTSTYRRAWRCNKAISLSNGCSLVPITPYMRRKYWDETGLCLPTTSTRCLAPQATTARSHQEGGSSGVDRRRGRFPDNSAIVAH
jgi:GGDEF domain-containing protein